MAKAPLRLNLGCGFDRLPGYCNVDAFAVCEPDVVADLNQPLPWADNSVDEILAKHVFEHVQDWWGLFRECGRVLKPGGVLEIRVPDESSSTALTYRDHLHVFSLVSFHGSLDRRHGTNAWAVGEADTVPLRLVAYRQVPHKEYNWMTRWPFNHLLLWCSTHLRNFIHEQRFYFQKPDREAK